MSLMKEEDEDKPTGCSLDYALPEGSQSQEWPEWAPEKTNVGWSSVKKGTLKPSLKQWTFLEQKFPSTDRRSMVLQMGCLIKCPCKSSLILGPTTEKSLGFQKAFSCLESTNQQKMLIRQKSK